MGSHLVRTDGSNAAFVKVPSNYTGNLNSIVNAGVYFTEGTGAISNNPFSSSGSFLQFGDAGGQDVRLQFYAKSSLDRIAFRNQWGNGNWGTWKEFWTDANDGSGSGLDADLLDGQHGSYYAAASALSSKVHTSGNTGLGATWKTTFYSGSGGATFGANHYSMGVDVANGSWSGPNYSDLIIGYHTGIRIGAAYGGTKFYNNSPTTDTNNDGEGEGTEALLMTVGGVNGGSGVKIQNALIIAGAGTQQTIDTTTHSLEIKNSGATGSGGLVLQGSSGTHGLQLYWDSDGAYYGFLDAAWANWDIQKARNGAFKVDEGSGLQRVWNAGNDGAGSGLDADLLDGQQGTYYANESARKSVPSSGNYQITNSTAPATLGAGYLRHDFLNSAGPPGSSYRSVLSLSSYTGGSQWTQLSFNYNQGINTPIYFRQNQYNGSTWSSWHQLWDSVNDGSGSGLDADLLDGVQGSGYARLGGTDHLRSIPNRWFATADADNNIDYYQHNYAKAHLGNTYKYTNSRPNITTDSNYWVGSMGWGQEDLNTILSYGSGFWDSWSSPANRPSTYTSHWNGFNAMHYSASSTYHHGMQMAMGAGNPSHTYLRGWWSSSSGYAWQKIWTDGNDGAGSGLVADYATKVTFNTQGNSNTTLKLLLGDTSNSTIASGTVYKDNELSYNTSSNTLNTGSINFSNWNYTDHQATGSGARHYVHNGDGGSDQTIDGSQGSSNLRTVGISSTGELGQDIVEQSFTYTRAQFHAMSLTPFEILNFNDDRGSNPGRIPVILEVLLMLSYSSPVQTCIGSGSGNWIELVQDHHTTNKKIAGFLCSSVQLMCGNSGARCALIYQDRESRLYYAEKPLKFKRTSTNTTLHSNVTHIHLKIRYKFYDGASF